MPDISVLAPFANDDSRDFSELVASCGRFIDAWQDAGGDGADEPVIGFYGLWAQSLDLDPQIDRGTEEASFYEWALPFFIRSRDEVRALLKGTPMGA